MCLVTNWKSTEFVFNVLSMKSMEELRLQSEKRIGLKIESWGFRGRASEEQSSSGKGGKMWCQGNKVGKNARKSNVKCPEIVKTVHWKWLFYLMFESESRSVVSDSLQPHGLYSPWNSPGQNTGVGSFSLLQGIFPTQGSNPGLLHYRQIPYQLSHKGFHRLYLILRTFCWL